MTGERVSARLSLLAGRLASEKEVRVRLQQHVSAVEIERILRSTAREIYGDDHAASLNDRLRVVAEMLARVAAAPVAFAGDPPDLSGIREEPDDA